MPLDDYTAVTRTYPNIVPPDNLRLPDALTIKHGPAPLLARFVLRGDRAARDLGVRLRLRHDFDELVDINRYLVAKGLWYPLINMFDPEYTDLLPENAYWLSGEDEYGNIVLTWAARVFYWPETTLADHIGIMLCEKRDRPRSAVLTREAEIGLRQVSGVVFWGGSYWIHPEFRHRRLSPLVGRLGRAFAVSRWPVDWVMCLVERKTLEGGYVGGYGYRHVVGGIGFPGSQFKGEVLAVYLSADEAYEDMSEFMEAELGTFGYDGRSAFVCGNRRLQTVTRTSSEVVAQGSTSRS